MALSTIFQGRRGGVYKASLVCCFLFIISSLYSLLSSFSLADAPLIISSGADREAKKSGFTVSYQSQDCIDNQLAQGSSVDLNGELNISVWNIYKQNNAGWKPELSHYVKESQLTLLQEAKWSSDLIRMITDFDLKFVMVRAFNIDSDLFGVMSLSKVQPIKACGYLMSEPLIRFPKSALSSYYHLSNGQQLLVINLHSINFEIQADVYQTQLTQVGSFLSQHEGPVIFAGDFNTWSDERSSLIQEFANLHQLTPVSFAPDKRTQVMGNKIDHIFYRQLNLLESHTKISDASDHHPMTAKFSLNATY